VDGFIQSVLNSFGKTMSFKIDKLILIAIALLLPACCPGQEARPPLIPSQQAGPPGAGASAASTSGIGGLTDGPITPGEIVRINVFDAPDFSIVTRVSQGGDIP
jgi:hypothetical protein